MYKASSPLWRQGQYFEKGEDLRDLPAVAQHGNARGNDSRNGGAAPSGRCALTMTFSVLVQDRMRPNCIASVEPGACGPVHAGWGPPRWLRLEHITSRVVIEDPLACRQHGYPHPRSSQQQQQPQQQQQQQQPGHEQYAGYYDAYGQWHGQGADQSGAWEQTVGGYGGYAGGVAPPGPPKPEPKVAKGKGFSMKMGDRARVANTFTLEQRQAREGKGVVGAAEAADEYGADILLGAGGMVRPPSLQPPAPSFVGAA